MNKKVAMLGLARKAGKLSVGIDCVKQSLLSKQANLVIVTCDVSERSLSKIKKIAQTCKVNVVVTKLSMDDMACVFGKKVGIMAVNDENFAKKIIDLEDY